MFCPGLPHRGIAQQVGDRRADGVRDRRQVADRRRRRELAAARPVPEGEVPDLRGARRQRQPDQFGVVRLERGRLGVERHEGGPSQSLSQALQLSRVIDDGDCEGLSGEAGKRGGFQRACFPASPRPRLATGDPQPPRQPVELELREHARERLAIRLLPRQTRRVEGDRHVLLDGHQFAGESGLVRLLEQRLADPLARDVGRVREDGVEVAILLEQLARSLVPDALHPGYVVRAVAHHRQVVGHLPGRHAEAVRGVRFVPRRSPPPRRGRPAPG